MATNDLIKLSIVVPFYNTEAYLNRCMTSLLNQTLSGIEIICVNDGSPDNCLAKLRKYESAHPSLVRVIDKPNGGLWNARWSGTDIAKGAYVAFVDSDDYVEPTFAEDFYNTATKEDADIVVCGFTRIDEHNGKVLSKELSKERLSFYANRESERLIEINPAAWNKCFRRDLLERMNRLEEPPSILEDVTLSQLAYLASSKKIAFTGTAPYRYVIREGSMINTVTIPQVDSVKRSLLEVSKCYEKEHASETMRQALDATVFLHLGISMLFRLSCSKDIDLKPQIQSCTVYLDRHFPTWRHSPYINTRIAFSRGGAYFKLYVSRIFYKTHLMVPFLAAYRFYLKHSNCDLKW